jgi:hypothetical protein
MKKLALFCFLAITVIACKKDKFAPPEVQTLSATAVSTNSITLVGNIVSKGKHNLKDYGFVYSTNNQNPDVTTGTKVSLGANPGEGEFSKTIENINLTNSIYGNVVWARAYITDDQGTAFGSTLSVNLPRPNSTSIVPNSGQAGDVVKISGKFYNPNINFLVVNFQNIKAKVITATDTELTVEVPRGVTASHNQQVQVTVSVDGSMASNSHYFTMLANVRDFSPKTGPVGTLVILSGDNLPTSYYSTNFSVYFGGVQATVYNYYNQVTVPFNVTETSELSVLINGQKKVLPGVFTVTAPQITAISPETVLPGQSITISGSNFPTRYDNTTGRAMIKLGNGSYVDAGYSSSTSFSYQVPTNTADGDYTLYYKVGPHEIQAPKKLKVLGLSASSFSPTTGAPGREVNITGNFVSGSGYYVAFGTVNAYGTATSSTNLRVIVPTGINAGKVKITVDPNGRRIVMPGEFEILGPTFTSFSPTSGVAGTQITIKGSGFYPGIYGASVAFGTVNVTPISVTENTIVVAVPSNVTPGAMKLSVITGGQTVTHNDNFTKTN